MREVRLQGHSLPQGEGSLRGEALWLRTKRNVALEGLVRLG